MPRDARRASAAFLSNSRGAAGADGADDQGRAGDTLRAQPAGRCKSPRAARSGVRGRYSPIREPRRPRRGVRNAPCRRRLREVTAMAPTPAETMRALRVALERNREAVKRARETLERARETREYARGVLKRRPWPASGGPGHGRSGHRRDAGSGTEVADVLA